MSIIHGDHRIRDRKGHFTASWCQPISCQYICQYQTNSCQYLNQYHPIIKCETCPNFTKSSRTCGGNVRNPDYAYLKSFLLFKSHNPLIIYTVITSKYFQLKTVWFEPPHQLTEGYGIIVYPYEHSFLTTKRLQLSVPKIRKSRT